MHIEFRVRTLCELVLNEKYYLHPSIIAHLCPDGIVGQQECFGFYFGQLW